MNFIDLFAGIGGFRLGLETANDTITQGIQQRIQQGSKNNSFTIKSFLGTKQFTCVWSNEWDKYARQIYKKHWEECDGRDIREVPTDEIPDHDFLCAGFPCQSFSIAGQRKGFRDTRGTLFFEICRILKDKRPSYLLLENVKGLLSHQDGWTFATMLLSLDEVGYDVEWQVLNSKHFGVPQNRERVFLVGHLRGECKPEVFPIREVIQTANTKGNVGDISGTISTKNQSGQANWDRSTTLIQESFPGELREYAEIAPTISTPSGGQHLPYVANTVDCDGYLRDGRRKRVNGKAVLTSMPERRIRRLTPIECERLQGFPDNWTEGVSDTQRYKMLGNAVTVNVIEAIGKGLICKI